MNNKKDLIRSKLKTLRNTQSQEFIINNSTKIKERLFSLSAIQKCNIIAFYSSIDNEVQTHDMIDYALSLDKQVCLPKLNSSEKTLTFYKINSRDSLKINSFGILEPSDEPVCTEFDIIIIPGIAFDQFGHRIGFGHGYYDIFLTHAGYTKIALAFDFQVLDRIPTTEYDIPVDVIVTETTTIQIK
tara:strand:- start:3190 stop:3747 length:558 start_codon:yes stop_codon:yes gene_type:complete